MTESCAKNMKIVKKINPKEEKEDKEHLHDKVGRVYGIEQQKLTSECVTLREVASLIGCMRILVNKFITIID